MYRRVANVSSIPTTDMRPVRQAMGTIKGAIACMVAAVSLMFASVGPALADTADKDAEQFVKDLADEGLAILADESLPMDQKKKAFGDLVVNNADIQQIGYFTLAQYKRMATPEQLAEFSDLYMQYTRNFYESRLGGFSGESLKVKGSLVKTDNQVVVLSVFKMGDGSEIPVDWRLKDMGSTYVIYDLYLAGISMAQEQKSQFTSVIANNGNKFEALLTKLREMVGSGESFDVDTTQTN